ncbi:hypothetical protein [Streptomyces sp. NBC_00443]|uniref:hypothetical protein n=1 Tax=Streptomyces sp. NBC_00443 TaxID=2975743 RepID=UPI003FA6FC8C
MLTDSARLGEFAAVFDTPAKKEGPPTHLHFHVARILQGTVGIPETGGMYQAAIEDVSTWTVGDFQLFRPLSDGNGNRCQQCGRDRRTGRAHTAGQVSARACLPVRP